MELYARAGENAKVIVLFGQVELIHQSLPKTDGFERMKLPIGLQNWDGAMKDMITIKLFGDISLALFSFYK